MPAGVFRSLSASEYQKLIDAIPLIAILIAGADGHIDFKEKEWAEKLSKIRSYAHEFDLKAIYQEVDKNFKPNFESWISKLPTNANKRCKEISLELASLNAIFAKLNMRTASQLYNSYLSYSEQVAKASGGFLRLMAVNVEENIYIGLPMLDPIFFEEIDDDE
ncbi:MAG: hypothetical protein M3Q56_11155 [Bacteroidota bacterium]|nr:hypothetical protein [Bacteroidota bacterium]